MRAVATAPLTVTNPTAMGNLKRRGQLVDDPIAFLDAGLVRMARDHDAKPLAARVHAQLREIVNHQHAHLLHLHDFRVVQRLCPRCRIVVTAHRGDWGNLGQRRQYFRAADVAGVHDAVATAQALQCLGAQQTMRIRDDTQRRFPPLRHQHILT
jgi:hypothetical protein